MLIAHFPSGYIVAHLSPRYRRLGTRTVVAATLTGAIFPDIDMLYFYLFDNQQTHHHFYPTHWPLPYVGLLIVSAIFYSCSKTKMIQFLFWFSVAAVFHMFLDSVAAPMMWLAPFSDLKLEFIEIPATQPHWILNFIFHWTFLLELTLCTVAAFLFVRRRAQKPAV